MLRQDAVGVLQRSLPSRERGLKLVLVLMTALITMSLPSRERGLKLRMDVDSLADLVRRSLHGSVD